MKHDIVKVIGGISFLALLLYCVMADGLLDKLGPIGFLAAGAVLCGLSLLMGDPYGKA